MTVDDVLTRLPRPPQWFLPVPKYARKEGPRLGFAVESMKRHMTDEGWQLFAGLKHAGYQLAGRRLPIDDVDVRAVLDRVKPAVAVLQDKREWDAAPRDFRDQSARFVNYGHLQSAVDVFKLTVLKDAHQRPEYHRQSAEEIGCHAWVVYYHPRIVKRLAPYVREQHMVRTYHSVDSQLFGDCFDPERRRVGLLSGAVSSAYPLRARLVQERHVLRGVDWMKHPGYHMSGCATPAFIAALQQYRVSICTASIYGYALRKIVESTAAGCVVVTDLPEDDALPHIDGNLVRVPPSLATVHVARIVADAARAYDPVRQREFALKARAWYDYRAVGARLANDIENMRCAWNAA